LRYLKSFTASSQRRTLRTPTFLWLDAESLCAARPQHRGPRDGALAQHTTTTTDHIPSSSLASAATLVRFNLPINFLAVHSHSTSGYFSAQPPYNVCQTPSGFLLAAPLHVIPTLTVALSVLCCSHLSDLVALSSPADRSFPQPQFPIRPTELTRAPFVPPCPLPRPRTAPPML
jgi:hypothetical protein